MSCFEHALQRAIPTGAVMEQTSHIGPAEVTALLVQKDVPIACSMRPNGVRFGGIFHGLGKTMINAKYHSLHWSSADPTRAPATCFPLVEDSLQCEVAGELIHVVNDKGTVSHFASKKARQSLVGLVKLVQGSDGVYTKSIIQLHKSWLFYSQMISDEEISCGNTIHAMELFCKKLVMWIFSSYAREPTTQLTLRQLETAFPLLTSVDVQDRRRVVSRALTRFAGGLLSFYDDRVIALKRVPVHAFSLLSLEEFRMVTSMEQASVAFLFKCQMRHDEVLEALQTVLDAWGKRGTALASSFMRLAVAVLLSHAVGTCALLPQELRGSVRPFVFRYLSTILTLHGEEPIIGRLAALLRQSKTHKRSTPISIRRRMEEITRAETIVVEPSAACAENDTRSEVEGGYFFESVAPLPQLDSEVAWKIAKCTCRHTIVSLPKKHVLKNNAVDGSDPDRLFSALLFSCARLHFSWPLLKSFGDEELCLSLNLGKASHATSDDEMVLKTARKRKRGRGRAGNSEGK
ncbi:hypothetical protein MOQ_002438 [Trypanosoma cruzi marinkellei]|uniref:Uncharacterized protein n=1 Tax=Trypanosoma cruzi marinkellei TaxID=85056 RepID=K2NFK9_TRYCR|nr:hypothetical protein MOQ_002438 [Trypanosoma cruzi marinkellei]